MTKEIKQPGKTGAVELSEQSLDKIQGGFAPLKPAELVNKKRPQSQGFFLPEVDDEVIA